MTPSHLLLADAGVLLAALSALLAVAAWGAARWGETRHDGLRLFAWGWASLAIGLLGAALSVPATFGEHPIWRAVLVGASNVAFLWNAGFMYGALRRVVGIGPYPLGSLGSWLGLYAFVGLSAGALSLGGISLTDVELLCRFAVFGWCAVLYLQGAVVVLSRQASPDATRLLLGVGAGGFAACLLGLMTVLPGYLPGAEIDNSGLWLPLVSLVAVMIFAMGLVSYVMAERRARDLEAAMTLSEERLRAATSEAHFDAAMGAIGDATIQLDRELNLQAWNASFARLITAVGIVPEAGIPCQVMMSEDTRPLWEAGWRDILEGRPTQFRLVRRFGGTRRTIDVRAAPTIHDGRVTGGVAVLRDITELVDLEARFHHAQRSEAVGRLAYGVAHDFNNLLSALNMTVELAHEEVDAATAWQDVRMIAERGRELTRQLLDLARRRPETETEQFQLRDRIGGLAGVLRRLLGGAITLRVDHIDPTLEVRMGAGHFDQVLLNLVVNARDAMPEGGVIRISAGVMSIDGVSVVKVRVQDSGTGMSPEVLARALDPYFTTKGEGAGTGLGLSTCRDLALQAGGDLRLDSAPGRGTTVLLTLPLALPALPPVAPDAAATPAGPAAMPPDALAVIVDDDPMVLRSVDRLLQREGFRTIACRDGREALAAVHGKTDISLIVSDVLMPNLDGPTWVRMARQDGCRAPVLFVSGYDADRVDAALLDDLQATFLAKPFTTSELAAALESHRRPGTSGTAAA